MIVTACHGGGASLRLIVYFKSDHCDPGKRKVALQLHHTERRQWSIIVIRSDQLLCSSEATGMLMTHIGGSMR